MRATSFVFVATLALGLSVSAQISSYGRVPDDLKRSAEELYEASIAQAEAYLGHKAYDKHKIIQASYHISKIMSCGRVVYGDHISLMASRIADTLLKDFPTLRKELRFYTVKSPEVNAFATGNGMIFINAGLVAQVENEAQLAFVISHEIVHYFRHHALEKIMRKERITSEEDEQNELKEFLRTHGRSREMENEADSLGLAMFYLKSGYDKAVSEGIFDVLQYSLQPFDEILFDTTFFDTPNYPIRGCWLDKVAGITSRDNYDDSRSTHPNIFSRRGKCGEALKEHFGQRKFIVTTETEFRQIQFMARVECIRQEIFSGDYPKAFYNAWVMLRENPDNEMLNQMLVHSIYSVAMFKNNSGTNSMTGDYRDIEGESQQVYYALRLMTPEQATVAALNLAWRAHKRFPENASILSMCHDLMCGLRSSHKMSFADFRNTPQQQPQADTLHTDNSRLTKYERIKHKKQSQIPANSLQYAFADLLASDTAFTTDMKKHLAEQIFVQKEKTDDSLKNSPSIIVGNSQYIVYNSDENTLKEEKCMEREQYLNKQIMRLNKKFGYRTADFTGSGICNMQDADQYNEFVTLNEWLREFWQTKGLFTKQQLSQSQMDALTEHYGTSTVSLVNVVNAENIAHDNSLTKMILLPLIPYVIYEQAANREKTAFSTIFVDASNGKIISRKLYSYTLADHKGLIDAMLYSGYASANGKKAVGCLGHRLSVSAGINLGAAGYQPINIHKYVALSPWASVEYALSPTITLAADCRFMRAYPDVNKIEEDNYVIIFGNQDRTDMSKHFLTWSLSIHKYSNTDFAPLGPYFGAGLHYVQFVNPSNGSYGGESFGIHLSGGRNYLFAKRFTLNIEARYGYTAALLSSFLNEENEDITDFKKDALFSNFIQLKIGIGVLLF